MATKELDSLSPRDIMKARRPELFSDSERREEIVLTKSQLDYQLETLTSRKEETVFENFCRYLLKKELCPNLLPQTGPTGGGDSKVDSETYPVAETIAALWYVGDPERSSKERWAFAFSAKKDWESKIKSDVKKIVSADRGYTLIYFVTNQYVPDKKRASTEKSLQEKYGVEIRILDRTWILDVVSQNDRWDIVFDVLNIGEKRGKRISGPLDVERQRDLERLEAELTDKKRIVKGPQYVEDCLQAALLARGLERPRAELEGLFERAERECRKYGSTTQLFHILYKRAWTAHFWFNDYAELSRLYEEAEPLVISSESIWVLDNLVNLCQVGFTHAMSLGEGRPEQHEIWATRIKKLRKSISDRFKPSDKSTAALWSRTQVLFLNFLTSVPRKDSTLPNLFNGLRAILQQAKNHLDYPIEPIEQIIQEIGEYVSDNLEYDRLFELVTSIQSKRLGEAKQGRLRLRRGYQLLEADKRYESIDQMAKAQNLLAKEEHHDAFVAALMGTAMAFRSAELLWAARANMVVAADRALYRYVKNGEVPPPRLVSIIIELIWIELRLGRVMCALNWIELFYLLGPETEPTEEEIQNRLTLDALLSVLILRTRFDDLHHLKKAPGILEHLGFPGARAALLFCLGHEEQFRDEFVPEKDDLYAFAQKCIQQPAATGIPGVANWNTSYSQTLTSSVLGCNVELNVDSLPALLVGETILGYIEAFLSTAIAINGCLSSRSALQIRLQRTPGNNYAIELEEDECGEDTVVLRFPSSGDYEFAKQPAFEKFLFDVLVRTMTQLDLNASEKTLELLFAEHQAHVRARWSSLSLLSTISLLSEAPKYSPNDRLDESVIEEFPVVRKGPLCFDNESDHGSDQEQAIRPFICDDEPSEKMLDVGSLSHKDFKIESVIMSCSPKTDPFIKLSSLFH